MSKKTNIKNKEEVKNVINNMNEQINEIKQKMSMLVEQFAETEEPIANVSIEPTIKEKKKKQKAETEENATNIPIDAILDNNIVKIRKKKTKAQIFQNERKLFIDELEKKMGLTETKRGVLLYDLEHNEELMKFLKDNIPEIQKLYKCGSWNYFKASNSSKNSEIGLLKSIFKNENYNVINKQISKEIEGIKKLYGILHFYKV